MSRTAYNSGATIKLETRENKGPGHLSVSKQESRRGHACTTESETSEWWRSKEDWEDDSSMKGKGEQEARKK